MRFFIQKTHCSPDSFSELGFRQVENGLYSYALDGSMWKQRKLADMGWGRECGLCRLPELNFDQLISLVLLSLKPTKSKWYRKKTEKEIRNEKDDYYNFWGSLAVLLYDYYDEFIEYLFQNFTPQQLAKEHPEIYNYINSELNLPASTICKLSNKVFAACCIRWKKWINSQS